MQPRSLESNPDRFLTIDEIAQRWGTSKVVPYRAITAHRLPASNFGQGRRRALWRVRLSDLLEYERQASTGSK